MPIYLGSTLISGGDGGGTVIEGTGLLPIATLAALRGVADRTDGQVVYVRGHGANNDGGAGIFYWDAAYDRRMITTGTINAAGTAYAVGVEIRITTNASRPARWRVTSVDGTGGITGITLLDKGRYTSISSSTGVATATNRVGSGATLNITHAPLDDNGTIICPTGVTGAGRWMRHYTGPINVMWMGAKGDFATNDTAAIQEAINVAGDSGSVYLPAGRYIVTSTLRLLAKQKFFGDSPDTTLIQSSVSSGSVIQGNEHYADSTKGAVVLENFNLSGTAPIGIQLVKCQEARINNLSIGLAATTDVIYVVDCWGARFEKIRIYGLSGQACIHLHRPSGAGGNHAMSIDKVYTSNGTPVGILMDSATTSSAGVGTNITNCTLQGHTQKAVFLISCDKVNIDGLYTEATSIPIQLGDQSVNKWSSGVNITGCTFMTYSAPMTLDACTNVMINGCNLNVNNTASIWLRYRYARHICLINCTPHNIRPGIRRMSNTPSAHGVMILQGTWEGTPDNPASPVPAMIVMKSGPGGTAHRHYCMSVNDAGQWVAEAWVPDLEA